MNPGPSPGFEQGERVTESNCPGLVICFQFLTDITLDITVTFKAELDLCRERT